MADETKNPGNLNAATGGNGDTDHIKLPGPGQMPPKIQLRSAEAKKSTTRIDLAAVKPPIAGDDGIKSLSPEAQAEFFKKSTIRIDAAATVAPQSAPSDTSRMESKRSTIRLDQTGPTGETQKVPGETAQIADSKRSTIRLDQTNSVQGDTARIDVKKTTLRIDQPPSGATQPVQSDTSRIEQKRSTIRIEPGNDTQKVQGETARIDVKKSTIRIDAIPQTVSGETQHTGGETKRIDLKTVETGQMKPQPSSSAAPAATSKMSDTQQQKMKKETTRLEIPPEVAKRQTGKIQTGPVAESQDVFKKRTGKIQTAPVAMPPVVPVLSPSSAADTVARPKTILVRRPPKSAETPPRPTSASNVLAEATSQARKSDTARLEIPRSGSAADDRPTTRPKTIRIKRPDGTTARKQLTIARPAEGAESSLPAGLRAPKATAAAVSEPGGVWTILAIAAALVVCALIYLLLAQTYVPTLPVPGKIG